MGHYSANHLQADWDANSAADQDDRVSKANEEAGWYFALATKEQKAEYDATMRGLLGMVGPKWTRARDEAKAKFYADTAAARELCDRTVECLLEHGEVSEALSEEWDALIERAPAALMGAA